MLLAQDYGVGVLMGARVRSVIYDDGILSAAMGPGRKLLLMGEVSQSAYQLIACCKMYRFSCQL